MIILQAAMGIGLILFVVFGASVFIGIPSIAYLIYTIRMSRKPKDSKGVIIFESIVFAIGIVGVLLFIFWMLIPSFLSFQYT